MKLPRGSLIATLVALGATVVLGWSLPLLWQDRSVRLVQSAHPMLGGNPQHTGFTAWAGPVREPEIVWEYSVASRGR